MVGVYTYKVCVLIMFTRFVLFTVRLTRKKRDAKTMVLYKVIIKTVGSLNIVIIGANAVRMIFNALNFSGGFNIA